jgi:hypothetical protein
VKIIKNWSFIISAVVGACAVAGSLAAQDQSNRPAVFPNTGQPIPLGGTNQTSRLSSNTTMPSLYQGSISNLHDTIGTNAVNHGYNNPTLTNRPNPNLQMP